MSLQDFASIAAVQRVRPVRYEDAAFVEPLIGPITDYLREDLRVTQEQLPYEVTEAAITMTLISPILKEVWRPYASWLQLWFQPPLGAAEPWNGTPDFVVAKRSPLGRTFLDVPLLIVVEAKKDRFEQGWGQCLAGMIGAQLINPAPAPPIYGVTTNGRLWEFGRLQDQLFQRDPRQFRLQDLDELCAAVRFLLECCRRHLTEPAQAA